MIAKTTNDVLSELRFIILAQQIDAISKCHKIISVVISDFKAKMN